MIYYEEVLPFEQNTREEIIQPPVPQHLYQQYGCCDSLNNSESGYFHNTRGTSLGQYSQPPPSHPRTQYSRHVPPFSSRSIPQVLSNSYSLSPPSTGSYIEVSPPPQPSRDHLQRTTYRSSPYLPNLESFYDIPRNYQYTSPNRSRMYNDRDEYVLNSPPRENCYLTYPSYGVYPKLNGKLDLNRVGGYDSIPISPEHIPQLIDFGMSCGGDDGERKRKLMDDFDDDNDVPIGFKLPASKSPIMEAMAYCAIKRWGIEIIQYSDSNDDSTAKVVFRVLDFEQYYKYSCQICSKQNPTEDIGSRVKSLRRWFVNFPKKRDRRENPQFILEVKPEVSKKVYEMVEKYKCQISVTKRRRTK